MYLQNLRNGTLGNVQLHHVVSDRTGATGRRIVRAIMAGARDPVTLAGHRAGRCQASPETIHAASASLKHGCRGEEFLMLTESLHLRAKHGRLTKVNFS